MKKVKVYQQGKGKIKEVQNYLKGKKVLIILGVYNADDFMQQVCQSITIEYECIVFEEECTQKNIKMLANKMKAENFDSIIGFGGGKVLDIVKAVTYFYSCFLMVIPSSASMDGACSSLSVLYHDDHSFHTFLPLPKNPDVVIVDTEIIFSAPFALLSAGMIDAISSYYDCEYISQFKELDEEVLQCSNNCHDYIYGLYEKVKKDYYNQNLSEEVEMLIRTNIYDSAIAFENVGCEFSHILANATTKVVNSKGMHGERVGVSTLFQLALENKITEFNKLKELLVNLKMPTTLKDLQVGDAMILIPSIESELKELSILYSREEIQNALLQI